MLAAERAASPGAKTPTNFTTSDVRDERAGVCDISAAPPHQHPAIDEVPPMNRAHEVRDCWDIP
jgi:hypothetical protein